MRQHSYVALVAIGLGSNLGDREDQLIRAVAALEGLLVDLRASSFYESAPMYREDQAAFLNMAAIGSCDLGPWRLLHELKLIEVGLGRIERSRNDPREIDLDLLIYGELSLQTHGEGITALDLPHPRIGERRFVLEPLVEIWPDIRLPGIGLLSTRLAATEIQAQTVVRWDDAAFPLHRNQPRR